jgi:hypothetical protein
VGRNPATPPPATPTPGVLDSSGSVANPAPARKLRVYCEAKLEPVKYKKTDEKDVRDSVRDIEKAILKRGVLDLVPAAEGADLVVQVLERGREPPVVGTCRLRVRAQYGGQTVELTGQGAFKGINTWSGAAEAAAREVEAFVGRLEGAPAGN